LQELLTGVPVFEADTFPGICAAIAADPPAPLRVLQPNVPAALETVVLRCLEKDPARRTQSVMELMRQLEPFARRKPGAALKSLSAPAPGTSSGARAGSVSTDAETIAFTPAPEVPPSLRSVAGTTSAAPDAEPGAPARVLSRSRAWFWIGAGTAAAGLVAALVLVTRGPSEPAPEPPAELAPPAATAFTLLIESNPSGAEVRERDRTLGTTPLRLSVERESVSEAPRTFVLEREGYQSYTLVQGLSEENVRVLAALEPAPPAKASSASSAPRRSPEVAPPHRAVSKRPRAAERAPEPARSAPPPAASPDIRMQR